MEEVTKKFEPEIEEKEKEIRIKAYLLTLEGEEKGKIYEIKTPSTLIGRKYGNILVKDEMVSKKHAQIDILSEDIFYIKDLASTNGTYVNGKKISYYKLEEGDIIKIGNTLFKFLKKLYDENSSDQ
ncbi:MAG: FHA domain-containing protein [Thermoanaerobaculia bacterium]